MSQQKILLLENVAAQAAGVRERLALAGFGVAVSRYEAEGLKKLGEWQPHVVLLSTAHPAGNLLEFCLRVRSLAPQVRLVLASSLNRERLFQEFPGLAPLVDGVLLRPYSFEEVVELLRGLAPKDTALAPHPKTVAVLDRDAGTLDMIRQTLQPLGLEMVELPVERIAFFCRERRPAALVLEWPLSNEFIAGTLAALRNAPDGARLPVLLISGAAQDAVSRAAPDLIPLVDMFFRKPVAWEHFFRVLGRYLDAPDLLAWRAAPATPALAPAPDSAPAPAAPSEQAAVSPGSEEELRLRFQSQLEAKFLEVEELKRRLAAPGSEPAEEAARLREENDRLRQSVLEAKKKAELSLAIENLKRSELEVKLDNLLRMKEEFERRTEDVLEAQVQEIAGLRQELAALREGGTEASREDAVLREEVERLHVEKERLEERLHTVEADRQREQQAFAALDAEVQSRRAQAAEADAALADLSAKNAVREEELARERELRNGTEARLEEATRSLQEQAADIEKQAAEIALQRQAWEEKTRAQEEVKSTVVAEAEAAVVELMAKNAALTEEIAQERALREVAMLRLAEEAQGWREKAEAAAREIEGLQARAAQAAGAESADREEALRVAVAERDALRERCAALEAKLTAELRSWREKAETNELEIGLLRAHGEERTHREAEERKGLIARLAAAEKALREFETRTTAAREGLENERRSALAEKDAELKEALRERDEVQGRIGSAEAASAAEREAWRVEEETLRQGIEAERSRVRALEEQVAALRHGPESMSGVREELRRLQQVFEEVVTRARNEVGEYARREAQLESRLQGAMEEKRQLQERFDRVLTEATERDRRAATILENALKRSAEPIPPPPVERENLPAIIPAIPEPRRPGRRVVAAIAAGAAVLAILVAGYLGWRRAPAPAVQPAPAVRNAGRETPPAPPVPPPAPAGPREIWERWTRSDVSGGVLLQATLRGEQELRAEVETEKQARGWTEEQAQRELARLLATFRFDENYYFLVAVKNLQPGYPSYLKEVETRFHLRDDKGNESRAFLPAGSEKDRALYRFGAGELVPSREEPLYEATVPLAFSRKGFAPKPAYLQLLVHDVGATSRRVLTWELE